MWELVAFFAPKVETRSLGVFRAPVVDFQRPRIAPESSPWGHRLRNNFKHSTDLGSGRRSSAYLLRLFAATSVRIGAFGRTGRAQLSGEAEVLQRVEEAFAEGPGAIPDKVPPYWAKINQASENAEDA